jgi:hypothetical protein
MFSHKLAFIIEFESEHSGVYRNVTVQEFEMNVSNGEFSVTKFSCGLSKSKAATVGKLNRGNKVCINEIKGTIIGNSAIIKQVITSISTILETVFLISCILSPNCK